MKEITGIGKGNEGRKVDEKNLYQIVVKERSKRNLKEKYNINKRNTIGYRKLGK